MAYVNKTKELLKDLSDELQYYVTLPNGLRLIGTAEQLQDIQKDFHNLYYNYATAGKEEIAIKYAMKENKIDIALLNHTNHLYEEIGNKC